jgi:hypothetical protein
MNTTYRVNRIQTVQINLAFFAALFARLAALLPRLTSPANDPAALRYAANKNNGLLD